MDNKLNKVAILKLILEKKDILFGQFSATLTHKEKEEAWEELVNQCVSMGIKMKGWKYLRDTTWQNWRKATLKKKDTLNKTGEGVSPNILYDDADLLILEIIGKNSPVLNGLPVGETSGTNEAKIEGAIEKYIEPIKIPESAIEDNSSNTNPKSPKPFRKVKTVKIIEKDLLTLKKERIKAKTELDKLQIEIGKRALYKADLEIFKLESELKLPPSSFTEKFYMNVATVEEGDIIFPYSYENSIKNE